MIEGAVSRMRIVFTILVKHAFYFASNSKQLQFWAWKNFFEQKWYARKVFAFKCIVYFYKLGEKPHQHKIQSLV